MLRLGLAVTALALAACAPEIPDSNPDKGVGFGDYDSYRTQTTQAPPPSVETTVIPAAPVSGAPPTGPTAPWPCGRNTDSAHAAP